MSWTQEAYERYTQRLQEEAIEQSMKPQAREESTPRKGFDDWQKDREAADAAWAEYDRVTKENQ